MESPDNGEISPRLHISTRPASRSVFADPGTNSGPIRQWMRETSMEAGSLAPITVRVGQAVKDARHTGEDDHRVSRHQHFLVAMTLCHGSISSQHRNISTVILYHTTAYFTVASKPNVSITLAPLAYYGTTCSSEV